MRENGGPAGSPRNVLIANISNKPCQTLLMGQKDKDWNGPMVFEIIKVITYDSDQSWFNTVENKILIDSKIKRQREN